MAAREKSVIGAVGARILRFFSGDEALRKRVEKSQGWKKWKLLWKDLEENYDDFSDFVEEGADRVEDFWKSGKYAEKIKKLRGKTIDETQDLSEKIRARAKKLGDGELQEWIDAIEERFQKIVDGDTAAATPNSPKKSATKPAAKKTGTAKKTAAKKVSSSKTAARKSTGSSKKS